MDPVTESQVQDVELWISNLEEEAEIEGFLDEFGEQQPFAFTYLLTLAESEDFNEDEGELLFFLGASVWKMMYQANTQLAPIDEATLEEVKSLNLPLLEDLEAAEEGTLESLAKDWLEGYPQREILLFVVESILEEDEFAIRDRNKGVMIVFLKTLIDCLNR
ncbi:hypothetical protein [Pontibacter sp. G13]|uniref:hypothetical protein n=1 Tax=Pontibacter sp. G13 TaxID=3074898 RepID=UPI00288B98C8|nr:hypothetical protein [Pontibacter sp. G13]WNJ21321.1 hypothetical protein RJD25_12700 [Pontibacter sp. G13]